jgi:single-stranded-DNA-specific exonuclease
VASMLHRRGIGSLSEAEWFLNGGSHRDHDPFLLRDMDVAVQRLRRALDGGELIGLFGDFDVDGVTSCAVLKLGLEPLGAHVTTYIPDRFQEGYGLNDSAVRALAGRGVTLLLTADCGINANQEVDLARSLDVDIIILDHHTVPHVLPAAVAAVDPKRPDSDYPFQELAAVGVCFKLLQALYDSLGRDLDEDGLVDLVALGTVVDVAKLTDENRDLVRRGLTRLRRSQRPGLRALIDASGLQSSILDAEAFGFALGPRLNAAGRIKHADSALELVLSEDYEAALALATQLNELNRERQLQTRDALELARDLVAARTSEAPLLMVGHPEIKRGVVGLVAARLAQDHNLPAIAYEQTEDAIIASARCPIRSVNIAEALLANDELMDRVGGHQAAAGFRAPIANVDELRSRLEDYMAARIRPEDTVLAVDIDACVSLKNINGEAVRQLIAFEPCGLANERPTLFSPNVELVDAKSMGETQEHLKLVLRANGAVWPAVGFGMIGADLAERVDIVYRLRREYRGDRVELELVDLAPAGARSVEVPST